MAAPLLLLGVTRSLSEAFYASISSSPFSLASFSSFIILVRWGMNKTIAHLYSVLRVFASTVGLIMCMFCM